MVSSLPPESWIGASGCVAGTALVERFPHCLPPSLPCACLMIIAVALLKVEKMRIPLPPTVNAELWVFASHTVLEKARIWGVQ